MSSLPTKYVFEQQLSILPGRTLEATEYERYTCHWSDRSSSTYLHSFWYISIPTTLALHQAGQHGGGHLSIQRSWLSPYWHYLLTSANFERVTRRPVEQAKELECGRSSDTLSELSSPTVCNFHFLNPNMCKSPRPALIPHGRSPGIRRPTTLILPSAE